MSDSDCCTTLEKIKELLGKHENGEHEKNENKEKPNITYEPYKDKYTNSLMRVNRHSGSYHPNMWQSGGNRKSKKSKKSKKGKRSRKARKSRRKSNRRRGRR